MRGKRILAINVPRNTFKVGWLLGNLATEVIHRCMSKTGEITFEHLEYVEPIDIGIHLV